MTWRSMRWAVMMLAAAGCGAPKPAADPGAELPARLQALLDTTFAHVPKSPGMILRIEAPSIGLAWSGAVGKVMKGGEPLKTDNTVRMASNTKTYVAAAVLRLVEDGKVGLDSSMAKYLLPASVDRIRKGGYDPNAITVRMLLHHTSGLFDYAMAPQYGPAALGRPTHRWTRVEQLAFAMDSGKAYGKPDEVYHYSDTGYILLGELLETVTHLPMQKAVSDLLGFDAQGIKYTYFETLDSVPPGTPARTHQYYDTTDTYGLSASHDLYGGGGLVSNVENMAKFYRLLVRGELFHQQGTVDTMILTTAQSEKDRPGGYGMGIGRAIVDSVTCYGHSGFWGTSVRHCPSVDVTVATAVNLGPDPTNPLTKLTQQALVMVLDAVKAKKP